MRAFISSRDIEQLNEYDFKPQGLELSSLEAHDQEVRLQVLAEVKERLMHYKPQIVDDIGLCVSATILDFFEHIPEELEEKWRS